LDCAIIITFDQASVVEEEEGEGNPFDFPFIQLEAARYIHSSYSSRNNALGHPLLFDDQMTIGHQRQKDRQEDKAQGTTVRLPKRRLIKRKGGTLP